MPSVMPWYCSTPSFISDRFETCVPDASQQVAMMRGNFGPSADPRLVDNALTDFAGYLANSKYNTTVQSLEQEDRDVLGLGLNGWGGLVTPILVGVGIVVVAKLIKGR